MYQFPVIRERDIKGFKDFFSLYHIKEGLKNRESIEEVLYAKVLDHVTKFDIYIGTHLIEVAHASQDFHMLGYAKKMLDMLCKIQIAGMEQQTPNGDVARLTAATYLAYLNGQKNGAANGYKIPAKKYMSKNLVFQINQCREVALISGYDKLEPIKNIILKPRLAVSGIGLFYLLMQSTTMNQKE